MDNLADLLASRKRDEPPEIRLVKDYVQQHFKEEVGVLVRERDIVVMVRSSALAGALRMHAHKISSLFEGNAPKRLIFRVNA